MSVFGEYSRYYDLLYRDKNYCAEAEFISTQLRKHLPTAETLVELGCGTGRHAIEMARQGWRVTGVDLSAGMVEAAAKRLTEVPADIGRRVKLQCGDVRTVRLGEKADCVASLFHVLSYQTKEGDLLLALTTAAEHLQPGGLLLFDFWYGPAVLTDRPVVRVKRLSDDAFEMTRISEPEMRYNENVVAVKFSILLKDLASGRISEDHEVHEMRYFFWPELKYFLSAAGFDVISAAPWMRPESPLGPDSWYGCVIARYMKGS